MPPPNTTKKMYDPLEDEEIKAREKVTKKYDRKNEYKRQESVLDEIATKLDKGSKEEAKAKKKAESAFHREKADKDYDGDGEVESGSDEYLGSRDKAIKANLGKEDSKVVKEEETEEEADHAADEAGEDLDTLNMGSLKEGFWSRVRGNLHGHEYILREMYVHNSTGPLFIARQLEKYKDKILVLDNKYFEPCLSVDPYCKVGKESVMDHQHEMSWFTKSGKAILDFVSLIGFFFLYYFVYIAIFIAIVYFFFSSGQIKKLNFGKLLGRV
jgi:hypothetical protein